MTLNRGYTGIRGFHLAEFGHRQVLSKDQEYRRDL